MWVSHSAAVGGAELALAEGVVALVARGHQVHVVLPAEGPLAARVAAAESIHVIPLVKWASRPPVSVFQRVRHLGHELLVGSRRVALLARQLQVDVLVTNTITLGTGALAARWAARPHVWFLHEYGVLDHGLSFYLGESRTVRLVGRWSNVVFVNSGALERHYRTRLGSTEIQRVGYAVCVECSGSARRPGSSPGLSLVVVGQRAPSKGQLDAVLALAELRDEGLDVRLRLVGGAEPSYDERLRGTVAQRRLEPHVEFLDFTENPFELMERADVVLVCSPNEAFGRSTVEGMKLGRVVVGADCEATRELLHPEETGLLYRPGDHRGLASCLRRLYRDRGLCALLAARGQAFAEETFGLEQYGRALEHGLAGAVAAQR